MEMESWDAEENVSEELRSGARHCLSSQEEERKPGDLTIGSFRDGVRFTNDHASGRSQRLARATKQTFDRCLLIFRIKTHIEKWHR